MESQFLRRLAVEVVPIGEITPYANNPRRHSRRQKRQLEASFRRFGQVLPFLIDANGVLIAGHGRLEAALAIGMNHVSVIRLEGLTEAEVKAYRIADNRLAELSEWSPGLGEEIRAIVGLDIDLPLEITGFEGAVLDRLLDPQIDVASAREDQIPQPEEIAVTRLSDTWILGNHRLHHGTALEAAAYNALMRDERADMVFTDPPYDAKIDRNVSGLGKHKHREFVMGSGELGDRFPEFLRSALALMAGVSRDGAIHYVCMDWRGFAALKAAGDQVYSELKNLIVWVKGSGGMGTFYRSRHELVFAFKVGTSPHTNTFGLGETGRYRTNVWEYPGVSSFGPGRDEALEMHPTVKPVAMVADAIRDVTRRREIVLDPFGGSGTTLIAAQKTGRRARLLELDPLYCDVICRRWAKFAKTQATLEETSEAFDEVATRRAMEATRG